MNVADCLTPERVCFLSGATKREAIAQLIDLVSQSPGVEDRDELERAIWKREGMMSTGIGMGIGVPHVRLGSVRAPTMALGVHREGLRDYASLDDAPVQIIVLIVAGEGQHTQYIDLLAQLVDVLKPSEGRDAMLKAETPEAVYKIFTRPVGQ